MVFVNLLILVVKKGHIYLNKPARLSGRFAKYVRPFLLPGVKGLKDVLEIFKE